MPAAVFRPEAEEFTPASITASLNNSMANHTRYIATDNNYIQSLPSQHHTVSWTQLNPDAPPFVPGNNLTTPSVAPIRNIIYSNSNLQGATPAQIATSQTTAPSQLSPPITFLHPTGQRDNDVCIWQIPTYSYPSVMPAPQSATVLPAAVLPTAVLPTAVLPTAAVNATVSQTVPSGIRSPPNSLAPFTETMYNPDTYIKADPTLTQQPIQTRLQHKAQQQKQSSQTSVRQKPEHSTITNNNSNNNVTSNNSKNFNRRSEGGRPYQKSWHHKSSSSSSYRYKPNQQQQQSQQPSNQYQSKISKAVSNKPQSQQPSSPYINSDSVICDEKMTESTQPCEEVRSNSTLWVDVVKMRTPSKKELVTVIESNDQSMPSHDIKKTTPSVPVLESNVEINNSQMDDVYNKTNFDQANIVKQTTITTTSSKLNKQGVLESELVEEKILTEIENPKAFCENEFEVVTRRHSNKRKIENIPLPSNATSMERIISYDISDTFLNTTALLKPMFNDVNFTSTFEPDYIVNSEFDTLINKPHESTVLPENCCSQSELCLNTVQPLQIQTSVPLSSAVEVDKNREDIYEKPSSEFSKESENSFIYIETKHANSVKLFDAVVFANQLTDIFDDNTTSTTNATFAHQLNNTSVNTYTKQPTRYQEFKSSISLYSDNKRVKIKNVETNTPILLQSETDTAYPKQLQKKTEIVTDHTKDVSTTSHHKSISIGSKEDKNDLLKQSKLEDNEVSVETELLVEELPQKDKLEPATGKVIEEVSIELKNDAVDQKSNLEVSIQDNNETDLKSIKDTEKEVSPELLKESIPHDTNVTQSDLETDSVLDTKPETETSVSQDIKPGIEKSLSPKSSVAKELTDDDNLSCVEDPISESITNTSTNVEKSNETKHIASTFKSTDNKQLNLQASNLEPNTDLDSAELEKEPSLKKKSAITNETDKQGLFKELSESAPTSRTINFKVPDLKIPIKPLEPLKSNVTKITPSSASDIKIVNSANQDHSIAEKETPGSSTYSVKFLMNYYVKVFEPKMSELAPLYTAPELLRLDMNTMDFETGYSKQHAHSKSDNFRTNQSISSSHVGSQRTGLLLNMLNTDSKANNYKSHHHISSSTSKLRDKKQHNMGSQNSSQYEQSSLTDTWRQNGKHPQINTQNTRLTHAKEITDRRELMQRKFRSILNKLTIEKFDDLYQQILISGINCEEDVKDLMSLIFKKAKSQHHFIPMYVTLCDCLQHDISKMNIFGENNEKFSSGKKSPFQKLLIDSCESTFKETLKNPIIAPEGLSEEEKFEYLLMEKTQMKGTVIFIAELCKKGIVSQTAVTSCIEPLLNGGEPQLETLCHLLFASGKLLSSSKSTVRVKSVLDRNMHRIVKLTEDKTKSVRIKCLLQDVVDDWEKGWVKESHKDGPKALSKLNSESRFMQMNDPNAYAKSQSRFSPPQLKTNDEQDIEFQLVSHKKGKTNSKLQKNDLMSSNSNLRNQMPSKLSSSNLLSSKSSSLNHLKQQSVKPSRYTEETFSQAPKEISKSPEVKLSETKDSTSKESSAVDSQASQEKIVTGMLDTIFSRLVSSNAFEKEIEDLKNQLSSQNISENSLIYCISYAIYLFIEARTHLQPLLASFILAWKKSGFINEDNLFKGVLKFFETHAMLCDCPNLPHILNTLILKKAKEEGVLSEYNVISLERKLEALSL